MLLAAPVVDIDGTFFVQGGLFLALMLVLRPLLFQPWLATRARRAEAIEGAQRKATDLRSRADTLVADYESRLAKGRDEALDRRADVRRGEEQIQAKRLADARLAANTESEAARKTIVEQAEAARTALASRVDELAGDIVRRLLRRPS